MIVSIKHKGLKLLWQNDDSSKLPQHQIDKIRRILSVLDTIKSLTPLKQFSGYKLHSLTGKLSGFWSVTVSGNFRIIFRFENKNVYDVDYFSIINLLKNYET